jgi:SpoIID/LytB domain protein
VLRAATAATTRAADDTAGRILLRDAASGAAASVYFAASCGGHTELPSAVWPGAEDPPFLPSREDDACGGAPAWSAELSARDLLRALREAGFSGTRIRGVSIDGRTGSGRVARLRIDGVSPSTISGQDLRVAVGRALGWQYIKSTAFEVRRDGDGFRFTGHGSGHGVGLCVIGSARLAERGETAEAILARYFPGLPISPGTPALAIAHLPDAGATLRSSGDPHDSGSPKPAAPPAIDGGRPAPEVKGRDASRIVAGVLVALPEGDEGERSALARLTAQARDALAQRLGVTPPPTVTLRVHATSDEYERATGDAWFTSGALANGDVHLMPLAMLRGRGILDLTIRRGLARMMTDAALQDRAAWVREGVAAYFADPAAAGASGRERVRPLFSAPAARGACPSDEELQHPLSPGAFGTALARARVCVARQLTGGRDWRAVR